MASLLVTQGAVRHVANVIRREQMERPLVIVQWDIGEADLSRAPDGEAFWERGAAQWRVTVVDVAAFEREIRAVLPSDDVILPASNATISGLDFLLYGRPGNRMLEDCRLELSEGELRVYENAL
jgi:hypothetical protein